MQLWNPILFDKDREQFKAKAIEIADVLHDTFETNNGLLTGNTGICLFMFYCHRVFGSNKYLERGIELLNLILADTKTGQNTSFGSGLSGIAWTLLHLERNGFLKSSGTIVDRDVFDHLLFDSVSQLKNGDYDWVSGAMGNGAPFLEIDDTNARIALQIIIRELIECSVRTDGINCYWKTTLNFETDERGINLGLAHGIPSILHFLTKSQLKLNDVKITQVIFEIVNSLRKFKFNRPSQSQFPSWVSEKGNPQSRLGWCYGDLGIGYTLLYSSINLNDKLLKEESISILIETTKRSTAIESSVVDAGLCHGAAGIAHMYNRAYHLTDNVKLKRASYEWYQRSLFMSCTGGPAGYHAMTGKGPVESVDFITGIAGIGLSYLAAISDVEPKWDSALMLS